MPPPGIPRFFDLLSPSDQARYVSLRTFLLGAGSRSTRHQRLPKFQEMLTAIGEFCEQPDGCAASRYFVCGVCPLADGFAINIRVIRALLRKCKSSINGSFQRFGCTGAPLKGAVLEEFLEKLPPLRHDVLALREWSLRIFRAGAPREPGTWGQGEAACLPSVPEWDL
jgi:hypothetical protein